MTCIWKTLAQGKPHRIKICLCERDSIHGIFLQFFFYNSQAPYKSGTARYWILLNSKQMVVQCCWMDTLNILTPLARSWHILNTRSSHMSQPSHQHNSPLNPIASPLQLLFKQHSVVKSFICLARKIYVYINVEKQTNRHALASPVDRVLRIYMMSIWGSVFLRNVRQERPAALKCPSRGRCAQTSARRFRGMRPQKCKLDFTIYSLTSSVVICELFTISNMQWGIPQHIQRVYTKIVW